MMAAPDEAAVDPLDALKDEWQQHGYCLGRSQEGPLLAFYITDPQPAEHLLEAGTPEELDALLRADSERRGIS